MLLQSSAYSLRKKIQIYQYLFYDYHLFYILVTVWDTSTSISNSAVFLYTALDPLKQKRLDFSNPKQTCVIPITWDRLRKDSFFKYCLCRNASRVKLLALSCHTTVDWKHQRCKCIIDYLKDSSFVNSFLFLFIHNMDLLQGLVAITTGVGVENT